MTTRARAFVLVGLMGFVVQLAVLAWLTHAGWRVPAATLCAVEAALVHNFWWHERWTWRDRAAGSSVLSRLVRFHAASGVVSLVTNVALTSILVRTAHLMPVVANVIAVAAAAVANYLAADRWVFGRAAAGVAAACVVITSARASAAPAPAALDAWNAYVARAEAGADGRPASEACAPDGPPAGGTEPVPGATIHRWTGCVVAHGITVPALVDRLVYAGPPPQDDVLAARVMLRDGDRLRVYLKVMRRAIVTVAYDTEHDVQFRRTSPTLATSRSVSTRIAQSDGGDHGFLWRLNSYWTYRQQGADVRIDLVSLSLSRDVPLLARPVAGPIIAAVARESVARTLEAVRRFAETGGRPQPDALTGAYEAPGEPGAPGAPAGPGASTETPAASRAARMPAARLADPGASPWTHKLSTRSAMMVPSSATRVPAVARRTACCTASPSSSTAPGSWRDRSSPRAVYRRSANPSWMTVRPAERPA